MKALIVPLSYTRLSHCFGIILENIERLNAQGANIVVLSCNAELDACDWNPWKSRFRCRDCISRRKLGISSVSKIPKELPLMNLKDNDVKNIASLKTQFNSLDELKAYKIEGFDVGMAAASTLISWRREPNLDVIALASVCSNLIRSGVSTYLSMINHLALEKPDRVYIFSGRTIGTRAILRACQHMKTDCYVMEGGNDIHHFKIEMNHGLHEKKYHQAKIRERWASAGEDREAKASSFFVNRASRREASGFEVQTSGQTIGLLPQDWNSKKRNVAIFTSAEDEFAAIDDEWKNPLYLDQLDGLTQIQNSLILQGTDMVVYVRIHPNQRKSPRDVAAITRNLTAPFFRVILPTDKIDSYALLKEVDCVLTFGSTVGLEATYWGIPSVLAGPALWDDFNVTYNPRTHEELMSYITSDLSPKASKDTLPLGYWLSVEDFPFLHYQPVTAQSGKMRETIIQDSAWMQFAYRVLQKFIWSDRIH